MPHMDDMLNTPLLPEDAGRYADGLSRILGRIPERWGRWIRCDAGWYQLIVDLDTAIYAIAGDYEVHQVKQKYGTLRYHCALPTLEPACCAALDGTDPRPYPGPVTPSTNGPVRTEAAKHAMDAWWARTTAHLDSPEHAAGEEELAPAHAQQAVLADQIHELVAAAETRSAGTCETCGSTTSVATRAHHYWYRTLCQPCATAAGYAAVPAPDGDDLDGEQIDS